VKTSKGRLPVDARTRKSIREALGRIFPGRPIVRCIVRGTARGWVGYAVLLDDGRVTVAISPQLRRTISAPHLADELLREGGLVQPVHPGSSVFILGQKRRAVWLSWAQRVFKPRTTVSTPLPTPIPQNVVAPQAWDSLA
jgi:hypothetical protein